MRNYHRAEPLRVKRRRSTEYPVWSILAAMALIYLTPFVPAASYLAFVICLYRVVRFDAKVFATDYCLLAPLTLLFRTGGGMTLLIYLCLLAAIWYFIRGGIRGDASYVMLILLLNYLVARMQLSINNFVLCFGQLFVLCVLLPKQDEESAAHAAKAFCVGLLASSVYALVFRNTWQIRAIRGAESEAIWGSGIMRFQGLLLDPNYYMTMLIIGLAMLIKLRDCGRISMAFFLSMGACMVGFGVLTYSKTFLLVLVLLGCLYILWQFRNGFYIRGVLLTIGAAAVGAWMLLSESSPFAVVLTRLLSAGDISDLTTGRTDVYLQYWMEITDSIWSFLFGAGLGAEGLIKDPHNLYLEIAYYAGFVGLALFLGFYGAMIRVLKRDTPGIREQNAIAIYVVPLMVLILHFTLHGMFQVVSYADFFLAFLSLKLVKKQEETVS